MTDGRENRRDDFAVLIEESRSEIQEKWMEEITRKLDPETIKIVGEQHYRAEMKEILTAVSSVWRIEGRDWGQSDEYRSLAEILNRISAFQAKRFVAPAQTALYFFSLRGAIAELAAQSLETVENVSSDLFQRFNSLMDQIGLTAFEAYARAREQLITEQSNAILELSTPIIKLWDNILLLPIIGAVDTNRASQIIEGLLKAIHGFEATMVILDVTGVPIIDTRVAQHLIQTVTAGRMLGAEVIITGISPDMAQTLVKLDIDLSMVRTKGRLQSGVSEAFRLLGMEIISE